MEEDGGITLIIDYGHDGDKTDTFRVCFWIFLSSLPLDYLCDISFPV